MKIGRENARLKTALSFKARAELVTIRTEVKDEVAKTSQDTKFGASPPSLTA